MKFIVKILIVATLVDFSVSVKTLNKFEYFQRSIQNKEPKIDGVLKFSDDEKPVDEKWVDQKLNNFDPQDERVWQMRYMERLTYSQVGGPMFIFVGGEWAISEDWLRAGHMHDMAKDLNGSMF